MDTRGFESVNSVAGLSCRTQPEDGEDIAFVTVAEEGHRIGDPVYADRILNLLDAEDMLQLPGPGHAMARYPYFEFVGVVAGGVLLLDTASRRRYSS